MGLLATVVRDAKCTVDPANHSGAKFWLRVVARALTSSQVLAVLVFRLSAALARTPLRPFAFLLRTLNVILFGTDIHPDARIGPGLALVHSVGIVIGPCDIGENFRIGQGSTIGELGRGSRDAATVGRPTIGDHVTVGTNAVVIGEVSIGDLSVIGACSLVIKDVASGWIVGGVPARPIRQVDPVDVFGESGKFSP